MIECEVRESFGRGNLRLLGRSFIDGMVLWDLLFLVDLYYCGSFLVLTHLCSYF
jgi:hypothetical protein